MTADWPEKDAPYVYVRIQVCGRVAAGVLIRWNIWTPPHFIKLFNVTEYMYKQTLKEMEKWFIFKKIDFSILQILYCIKKSPIV